MPDVSLDGVNIVVRGGFAPSNFSPAWLLQVGLIGADDREDNEIGAITQDIASFRCGTLFFNVTSENLTVSSDDVASFEVVRDVTAGLLRLFPHCHPRALGFNRSTHLLLDSIEDWLRLGDLLAPKDPWAGVLNLPATRQLALLCARTDKFSGAQTITIEPSVKVSNGLYVSQNDHYALDVTGPVSSRTDVIDPSLTPAELAPEGKHGLALEIALTEWPAVFARSEKVLDRVSSLIRGVA